MSPDSLELSDMLQPPIQWLASSISGTRDDLQPSETAFVTKAVPSRVSEFATGRRCARRLLAPLGYEDFALLSDSDRYPIWPIEVIGSITHCADACVVAIAPANEIRTLGIDIESAVDLEAELWKIVLTESEVSWLNEQPVTKRGILARVLFSAKEALYKAWYPVKRRFVEFNDVSIGLFDGCFEIEPMGTIRGNEIAAQSFFEGRWTVRERWIFTSVLQRVDGRLYA